MDSTFGEKRKLLLERIHPLGPNPLVSLEEFFDGNTDYGSIGCNLSAHPGPQFFYSILRDIRSKPKVQNVFVQLTDLDVDDQTWPFSDRVYVIADATVEEIAQWSSTLQPEPIEEGFAFGTPQDAPQLKSGMCVFTMWWD
jgi:hypothetical protein